MTFFQAPYQESIGKNEAISVKDRAYQSQRFRQSVFSRLAKKFAERAEEFGVTKSKIAVLLGKDKAQINRALSFPTNLTIDSISEFALALNCEPRIEFYDLSSAPRHNYTHHHYKMLNIDSPLSYDNKSNFLLTLPSSANSGKIKSISLKV